MKVFEGSSLPGLVRKFKCSRLTMSGGWRHIQNMNGIINLLFFPLHISAMDFGTGNIWWNLSMVEPIYGGTYLWWNLSMVEPIYGGTYLWWNLSMVEPV